MTKFFKTPHRLMKVALVVFGILAVLAIYMSVQNSSISQEKPDVNKNISNESALFIVGGFFSQQPGVPESEPEPEPLLLYVNIGEFSITGIDLGKFANLDVEGIHEARAFMVNGERKIALATYRPGKVVILNSSNIFWDDLTIEFEEELDERVRALFIGDVDGDDEEEVIVGTRPNGILKYYKFTNGEWSGETIDKTNKTIHDMLIMDSDGDGVDEIIITISAFRNERDPNVLPLKTPKILKYELAGNKWNKEVIWESKRIVEGREGEGEDYMHIRYMFAGNFDGDEFNKIVAGVMNLNTLALFGWDGATYSHYIIEDDLEINRSVITSGDIDNDGQQEIITLTRAGDVLLLYEYEGAKNKWKRLILTKDLVDEDNESITSVAMLNSSTGGYKEIFYTARGNFYTKFYVLEYDSIKDIWNRHCIDRLKLSTSIWGIFPVFP